MRAHSVNCLTTELFSHDIDDSVLDSTDSIDDTNEKQDASVYVDDSIGEERKENL